MAGFNDGTASTMPTQAIAPNISPGRLGLRPWNTREAFQTMPHATKPSACNTSNSGSPSLAPPMVHIATDDAPSR